MVFDAMLLNLRMRKLFQRCGYICLDTKFLCVLLELIFTKMEEITTEDIYRNITNIIEKIDIIESKIDSIYEVSIIIMDNLYNLFN